MGQLIYSMIVSLDGYVSDQQGRFDWGMPDEEVLAAVNNDMETVGTYLYGRHMYEVMQVWETDPHIARGSPGSQAFATLWQQADKVVYSTGLAETPTNRTQLRREFDPVEVQRLKVSSRKHLTVDGPTLAAAAFRHDLVDQIHMIICPVVAGGGLAFFPNRPMDLELVQQQRFGNGMVQLRYEVQHLPNPLGARVIRLS